MATTTPLRSGTKATPQAVFAACDQLRDEIGEFKNEEVLAITGGGLGTVSRLVKLYRQHEHIVAANEALDADATINLVQALDQLLKQQLRRSQQATDDFMSGAGREIGELADSLEQQEGRNTALVEENDQLRARLKDLETQRAHLEVALADSKRELADRKAQLTLKTHELTHTQEVHAAKLEQLHSEHQTALTSALETQRKAMNDEQRETLAARQAEHDEARQQLLARLDRAQAEKSQALAARDDTIVELREELHARDQRLTQVELAQQRAQAQAEARIAGLETLIEEKQQSLEATQRSHKQLQTTLQQQLATNTDAVTEQLTSVSSAADSVHETLSDIATLLQELHQSARNIQRPGDTD